MLGLLCVGFLLLDRAAIYPMSDIGTLVCWVIVICSTSGLEIVRRDSDD